MPSFEKRSIINIGTTAAAKPRLSRSGRPGPLSMSGNMPETLHSPPARAAVSQGTPTFAEAGAEGLSLLRSGSSIHRPARGIHGLVHELGQRLRIDGHASVYDHVRLADLAIRGQRQFGLGIAAHKIRHAVEPFP